MGTPLPAVANTIKVRAIQTLGDDANVENINYFTYDPAAVPLTVTDLVTFANAYMSGWATNIAPLQTTDLVLQQVQAIDLNSLVSVEANSTHAAVPGTAAPPTAPAATTLNVTMRTPFRGRSFRGRMYFSGQPRSQIVNPQHWDPAEVAGWQTGINAFGTFMNGQLIRGFALRWVIVSYFSGKIANPNPLSKNRFVPQRRVTPVVSNVTSWTANARITSQRRRNA